MPLGAFSVSLAVRDIAASRAFYETLGFTAFTDTQGQGWLILKDGDTIIGLFQGMFERNLLTINPGWDQDAQPVEGFEDVRAMRDRLAAAGLEIHAPSGLDGDGVASFTVIDPDGNPVLIDQHVPKPG